MWYIDTVRTVTVNRSGRLTLPTDVRRALRLDGETEMEVEVDTTNDAVILRPAVVLRREDAWAYTPEHRELLARAHDDSREGRVRQLNEDELKKLVG
jgi:AbrB family looped-hinge helix DNA binding protein